MQILTACLLLAPCGAAIPSPPIYINGQECPANVVTLSSPAGLHVNMAGNTTYILTGTSYTIFQDTAAPADGVCYLAQEGVGRVTITFLNGAKLNVNAGLLGLKGVTLTRSATRVSGVRVDGGVLAEDVAVQGFDSSVQGRSVIWQRSGGRVLLNRTVFSTNRYTGQGGAFSCDAGSAELHEVGVARSLVCSHT